LELSDQELIRQVINGSLESYDQLMERYQRLVFRIAYGFGRNKQNSMDITQNVFLKAYENLASFKGKGSFKAWIAKIAYNEGINWSKKNRPYEQSAILDEFLMNQSDRITQEDEVLAREHKAQLLKTLFSLNTRYRLAVVLRYFNEMPIKEISGVLKCSEGVVKSMLHRSLRQLKENLKEIPPGTPSGGGGNHERMQEI
jgi:RNA polymerase sigma-70 factor (ECF subfamily)